MKQETDLSLSIVGSRLLENGFRQALAEAEPGNFVEKPQFLDKARRQKRTAVSQILAKERARENQIKERASSFAQAAPVSVMETTELAVKSIWIEEELTRRGAVWGESSWNFVLSEFRLPKSDIELIKKTALEAFFVIKKESFGATDKSEVEKYIDSFTLSPNGARVDVVLTRDGPKVIEVNLNWVDGIQALSAFDRVTAGNTSERPIQELIETFGRAKMLAILNIVKGAGSRADGPKKELEIMASNLRDRNRFAVVECLNPWQTSVEYLKTFDGFYLNGDPKMIRSDKIPDWLTVIMEKSKSSNAIVFPAWCPSLDRKAILVPASKKSNAFSPTDRFSVETLAKLLSSERGFYLKGESYSSKKVARYGTPEFDGFLADAKMFPQEYVLQGEAKSIELAPVLGFDTSASKPVYLKRPICKFNVWVIGNKVAGILASLSAKDIISDKDFNIVPRDI